MQKDKSITQSYFSVPKDVRLCDKYIYPSIYHTIVFFCTKRCKIKFNALFYYEY